MRLSLDFFRLHSTGYLTNLFDVFGGRAAASADDPHSVFNRAFNILRKFFRINIIKSHLAVAFRQSGVRLERNGNGTVFQKLVHNSHELLRAERTVCTDCVNAHSLKHRRHNGRVCARHKSSVFAVCVRYDDRQVAVLLCGKHGSLRLVAVVHRFYRDEVNAIFHSELYRFGKYINRILKVKIAERFKQFSRRSYIKSNKLFLRAR